MRHSGLAALAAIIAMPGSAVANAEDEPAAAAACESDENFDAFDFWLGSWDVYVEDRKAGENTITKEEGGCLVLEKWTDVAGGTGQSYNVYNPAMAPGLGEQPHDDRLGGRSHR